MRSPSRRLPGRRQGPRNPSASSTFLPPLLAVVAAGVGRGGGGPGAKGFWAGGCGGSHLRRRGRLLSCDPTAAARTANPGCAAGAGAPSPAERRPCMDGGGGSAPSGGVGCPGRDGDGGHCGSNAPFGSVAGRPSADRRRVEGPARRCRISAGLPRRRSSSWRDSARFQPAARSGRRGFR